MATITAGDFRNGKTFEMDGKVMQVIEFQHVKPGKGAAFVRTKMKNVVTGAVTETSFNPTAKFEEAFIERKDMEYSYNDGDLYYFMDQETYDMIPLSRDLLGDAFRFVKENMVCKVLSYKGNVFGVECPNFVDLVVTETEPGFAGNTATNVTKPAVLETGAEIKVPLFIDIGDKITIDTRTGGGRGFRRAVFFCRCAVCVRGDQDQRKRFERSKTMEILEKVAYMKGLAEGLGLDTKSKEGKLLTVMIDILDDIALELRDIREDQGELEEALDAVSDDLSDVEACLYESEDEDEDEEDDADEDEEVYETTCPNCEEEIFFDETILADGCVECPNCGEKLEFDLDSLNQGEGCPGCCGACGDSDQADSDED